MIKNQKGQALIELIVFLPLIITLYSVIGGFASAINGSINQQKVTRAYFYYRVQHNSTIPGPKVSNNFNTWKVFGMYFIGWREYFVGSSPVMPCYKISIPFKDSPEDKCEERYTKDETLWVRVGTVYGICGATFLNDGNKTFFAPDAKGSDFSLVVNRSSCLISD